MIFRISFLFRKVFCGGLGAAVVVVLLIGCNTTPKKPDTGLRGTSRHTGNAVLLRVGEKNNNNNDQNNPTESVRDRNRFLPLDNSASYPEAKNTKTDIAPDDYVTIVLNGGFIKFFEEGPQSWKETMSYVGTGSSKKSRGEIAIVLSFEAGADKQESFIIHASEGQTLGSYLDLKDIPVISGIKPDGEILMRVVMIEIDRIENEANQQFIRHVANVAGTVKPDASPVISIASSIAQFLISQNDDEIVLDQVFSLKRATGKDDTMRSQLTYGTYALVLQEDRLRGTGAERKAPRSTMPVAIGDLRYDTQSGRLFKAYNYYPSLATQVKSGDGEYGATTFEDLMNNLCPSEKTKCEKVINDFKEKFCSGEADGKKAECEKKIDDFKRDLCSEIMVGNKEECKKKFDFLSPDLMKDKICPKYGICDKGFDDEDASVKYPTYYGLYREGSSPVDWTSFFFFKDEGLNPNDRWFTIPWYRQYLYEKWVNSQKAKDRRTQCLGYPLDGTVGDHKLAGSLNGALAEVFMDSLRYIDSSGSLKPDNWRKRGEYIRKIIDKERQDDGYVYFEYPVIQYPDAFTVLAQYPLHTHLIFSVERSTGTRKIHQDLKKYEDYITSQMRDVSEESAIGDLAKDLEKAYKARARVETALREAQYYANKHEDKANKDEEQAKKDEEQAKKDEEQAKKDKAKNDKAVCALAKKLDDNNNPSPHDIAANREILNEIFHLTERYFESKQDVMKNYFKPKDKAKAPKSSCWRKQNPSQPADIGDEAKKIVDEAKKEFDEAEKNIEQAKKDTQKAREEAYEALKVAIENKNDNNKQKDAGDKVKIADKQKKELEEKQKEFNAKKNSYDNLKIVATTAENSQKSANEENYSCECADSEEGNTQKDNDSAAENKGEEGPASIPLVSQPSSSVITEKNISETGRDSTTSSN